MKNTNHHLEELSEIRQIMERSTRFLSLSGWSGIAAGTIALLGAALAFWWISGSDLSNETLFRLRGHDINISNGVFLLMDAIVVLGLALVSAIFFSWRKANKKGEKIWSPVTRRLLFNLAVPLVTGALLILLLVLKDLAFLFAPITLIFYGLSLVNAGKYTNNEIIWLGLADIILGLITLVLPAYALLFWASGFGVLHIVYGIALYMKYDRKGS